MSSNPHSNSLRKDTNGIWRFFGINIPMKKKLRAGLPIIYGIGKRNVFEVCKAVGIDPDIRIYDLSEDQTALLREYIKNNLVVEGDLRGERSVNIKRLISINCYRGLMHKRGLPVRGQRTKTNARTRKGPRKSFSSKK